MKKIFIIAGEESGTNLGAKLMNAIRQKNADVKFIGIGGDRMVHEGLETIFPMQDINLMGFVEVLPHIRKLTQRIDQAVETIIRENPDILITIDSPGFNCRVVRKLKNKNFPVKKVHYVAPTVWAYKPKRAKKWAELFDHLICILPWEPPYFKKEGLEATFVGHPVFEELPFLSAAGKEALKSDYNYQPEDKIIAILPGSRNSEIKLLLPIFIAAAKMIYAKNPNAKFILMPTENMRNDVVKHDHQIPYCITVSDTDEKRKLLQICDAAIVKSGTVALEVTALKTPSVVCYKMNTLTHWMIRQLIKIGYVNLINIAAEKQIIPELIQDKCTPENISKEILKLINFEHFSKGQIEEADFELAEMGLGGNEHPSRKAADLILGIMNKE